MHSTFPPSFSSSLFLLLILYLSGSFPLAKKILLCFTADHYTLYLDFTLIWFSHDLKLLITKSFLSDSIFLMQHFTIHYSRNFSFISPFKIFFFSKTFFVKNKLSSNNDMANTIIVKWSWNCRYIFIQYTVRLHKTEHIETFVTVSKKTILTRVVEKWGPNVPSGSQGVCVFSFTFILLWHSVGHR